MMKDTMSTQTLYEVEVPIVLDFFIEPDENPVVWHVWVEGVSACSKQEAIEVIKRMPEQRLLSMLSSLLEEELKDLDQDNHFGINNLKQSIKVVKEKKCKIKTPEIKDVYEMDQDVDDMKKKVSKHTEDDK